jgi:hypothetical protein
MPALRLVAALAALALPLACTSIPRVPEVAPPFDDDLELPTSTAERSVPPGLTVTVSKKAILVDGAVVAPITAGKVDVKLKGDGEHGYRITPLIDALERRAKVSREVAKRAGTSADLRLLFLADRTMPYRLFTEVVYSCGQAGYGSYELVVKGGQGGSLAAISFDVPKISTVANAPPLTVVFVKRNAFVFAAHRELLPELPKLANGRYDFEGLTARMTELAASPDGAGRPLACVVAEATIPYETIIATVDAVRRSHDGRPLFPDIVFAAGVL